MASVSEVWLLCSFRGMFCESNLAYDCIIWCNNSFLLFSFYYLMFHLLVTLVFVGTSIVIVIGISLLHGSDCDSLL